MKKFLSLAVASVALVAGAGNANAASTLNISNVSALYSNAPSADLDVGNYNINNVDVSPLKVTGTLDGSNVSFTAYCVDLFQTAAAGSFEVVPLLSYLGNDLTQYNRIASLIDNKAGSGNMSQDAAVQLAVWELIYETSNTLDVTKNNFDTDRSSSSSLTGTANNYLANAVANVGSIDPNLKLYVAKSSTKQDLLFYSYSPAVPEPATWAMMIFGMGAVGYSMRTRRTTKVSFA